MRRLFKNSWVPLSRGNQTRICRELSPETRGSPRQLLRARGATLVEYLIGIGVASLVLTAVLSLSLYSGRSFVGLANYMDLNAASVRALDQISRDARQITNLLAYATNQVIFQDASGTRLSYDYSPSERTLTRWRGPDSQVLLRECDFLRFSIYQGTSLAGTYDQYPAANLTNCRVLSAQWTCSRKILGALIDTEDVQETKVVIRKH